MKQDKITTLRKQDKITTLRKTRQKITTLIKQGKK